ncbi:MAG: hypothetical protein AAGD96_31160 [Chloroflexota bacterium]
MRIIRMIFGSIIIIAALLGVGLAVGLYYYGGIGVDIVEAQVGTVLDGVSDNLDTTADALTSIKGTVEEVNDSVSTLATTASSLADSVGTTEPLFNQIKQVATEDVPGSLETVQETIPNIVSVAGTIDDTLTALSGFGFNQTFFGRDIEIDLGIDYDPNQRFDESMQELGDSLDGLPESLRGLSGDLDTTYNSLEAVGGNIETLSTDLEEINAQVDTIPPLLDSYLETVNGIDDQLTTVKNDLSGQLELVKTGLLYAAIFLGLLQLAPLAIGIMLFRPAPGTLTSRNIDQIRAEVRAEWDRIDKEIGLTESRTLEMPSDRKP